MLTRKGGGGVGVGWGAAFCRDWELGPLDLVSEMSP